LITAPSLSSDIEGSVLVIQTVPDVHADPVGAVERALNEVRQRSDVGSISAAVGPDSRATGGFRAIGRSLQDAHATLQFLTTLDEPVSRIISARTYATELNLSRTLSRSELGQLAENSLAPVIEWDRQHESELVHTLEQYLRNGCSATRTAARVFLHRQSLYQRIERIELLLGFSVSDPDLHTTLLMATTAHRLRSNTTAQVE
jgi:DNA-binding PucR family transcriptional regulator